MNDVVIIKSPRVTVISKERGPIGPQGPSGGAGKDIGGLIGPADGSIDFQGQGTDVDPYLLSVPPGPPAQVESVNGLSLNTTGDSSVIVTTNNIPQDANYSFVNDTMLAFLTYTQGLGGGTGVYAKSSDLSSFMAQKGAVNGLASLDSTGRVPYAQLPQALMGATVYQSTWNAATNTPALTSSTGTKGFYYIVSVPGSTNLDGITDWKLGDWAIYDGTKWGKVDNTDAVISVNGMIGAVTIATVAGANTQFQYNNNGVLDGAAGFSYNISDNTVVLPMASGGIVAYNTADTVTNYQKIVQGWVGNVYTTTASKGGTGVVPTISFTNGSVTFGIVGNFFQTGNANFGNAGLFNVGTLSSAANGVNLFTASSDTGFIFKTNGANTATNINTVQFQVSPTITQTLTAGFTAFRVSPFINTSGSGPKMIADFGLASAAGGGGTFTSYLSLNSAGVTTASSLTTPGVLKLTTTNGGGGEFNIAADADALNGATTALYIYPTVSGKRFFLGKSGNTIFSFDLSYVSQLNNVPAFATTDVMTFGYAGTGGSHMVGRSGASVVYNSSGTAAGAGDHIFYGTNTMFVGASGNTERVRFLGTDGSIVLATGDVTFSTIAKGPVVRTPDGTKKYRITVDNTGNLVTTLV